MPNYKCKHITIKNSVSKKLLGVIINNRLDYTEHLNIVCKKANLELHALNRISRFLSPEQHVLIIIAYIKSLFNYSPLVSILFYRGIMHKMNKIHERSLCLLLKNYKDDFQDLLRSSGDISIHQRCINSLLTEAYKYTHGLSTEIMNEVLSTRANIYTRQFNIFETHIPTSNRYGLNSIPYKANQLWNLLPENLKSFPSLTLFKNEIKLWECFNCPCNICKSYVLNLGYIVFYATSFSPAFLPILDTGLSLVSVLYQLLIHSLYMVNIWQGCSVRGCSYEASWPG